MADYGFNGNGFRMPRSGEILQELRDRYDALTGVAQDWARDTFLGAWSFAVSEVLGEVSGSLQGVWDGLNPNTAGFPSLYNFMALAGIERQQATFSRATLTLSGASGAVVPAGSQARDVNGVVWQTIEDGIIPGTVVATPLETGPIVAEAGIINEIVTPRTGWTGVTNLDPAVKGRNQQSEASAREALRAAWTSGVGGSFLGIQAEVANLPFVDTAVVVHNPSGQTTTVKGVSLPPNSFSVVVFPVNLTADEVDTLFETIRSVSPIGIESVGDEERVFESWPVRYSYAAEEVVNVAVTVELEASVVNPSATLALAVVRIEDFISSLGVGRAVRLLDLYKVLSEVDGIQKATSLLINGVMEDYEMPATRFAVSGAVTVEE